MEDVCKKSNEEFVPPDDKSNCCGICKPKSNKWLFSKNDDKNKNVNKDY